MHHPGRDIRLGRRARLIAALTGLLVAPALVAVAVAPASPASAVVRAEEAPVAPVDEPPVEDAPAPQLSITLTNERDEIRPGEELTFTAEIRNTGATIAGRVVLDAPAYMALGATDGATVADATATWDATLEAGSTTTVSVPATVGDIPETETRVTTLVSVYIGDSPAPVVRTAVANRIVGVTDGASPAAGQADGGAALLAWIIAGAVLVVLLAAAAIVLAVLRRRRRDGERLRHLGASHQRERAGRRRA